MAGAYDIGPRVGIDGEKAFNASIAAIKSNVKNLGSEMKLLTAQFGDNNKSMEALSAKNEVLRKTITQTEQQLELQNKKYNEQVRVLANLEGALNKATKEYGEQSAEAIKAQNAFNSYSAKVNKMAADINQSKASIASMTRELEDNDRAMEELSGSSGKMNKAFSFAKNAAKKMRDLRTSTDDVAGSMGKAHKHSLTFGDVVKGIVTSEAIIGGFRAIGSAVGDMVRNMADFAKSGIAVASDLQEVQNVVDVTFGEQGAAAVEDFAKKAAGSFGMSELSAKKFTGTMGAMLKSMNLDDAAVQDMSLALTGLAGDMASFYNLDAEEAFSKLRSGISGETEPLKQLGINMSVANLEAYALSQGINTAWKEMSAAEQATLRYQYIMQTTADAQGDFARTSDSYANQQRILQLNMENLSASIGKKVLPIITKFSGLLNDLFAGNLSVEGFATRVGTEISNLISGFSANLPAMMEAGGQLIGSVVEGVSRSLPQVIAAGQKIITQLQSEIISRLPIAIEWGFSTIENFASGIVSAVPVIAEKTPLVIDSFLSTVEKYGQEILTKGSEIIGNFAVGIISEIPNLVSKLPQIISSITRFFADNFPKIAKIGLELVLKLGSAIVSAIPQLVSQLPAVGKAINDAIRTIIPTLTSTGKDLVKGLWNGAKSWIGQLLSNLRDMAKNIVSTVKNALGIHSPSKVFAEIGKYSAEGIGVGFSDQIGAVSRQIKSDMGKVIPAAESGIAAARSGASGVSGASTDMVSAFKEALSGAAVYMDGKRVGSLLTTAQNNTTRARGQSPAMA